MRIQFDKSPSYGLHPGVQGPVLIVLGIEVILVILPLLIGDDSDVFSKERKQRRYVERSHWIKRLARV